MIMKKSAITFIIPFFGKPPSYIRFFLKSCQANPAITFLLFGDQLQSLAYENIKIIPFCLRDFNHLASVKLQMPVALTSAYKICDFRPAFGLIFEDYLKNARFWGTTDIDVLLGNIKKFLPEKVLSDFDVITAKKEYLIGHFTLYRNNRKVNNLFRKSADYQTVFLSAKSFAFDECNFLWWKLLAGAHVLDTKSQIESMSFIVKKYSGTGYIRSYFESHVIEQDKLGPDYELEPFSEELIWDNGMLTNKATNQEYLTFHFHFLKSDPAFHVPDQEFIPDHFEVSKQGFMQRNGAGVQPLIENP